MNVYGGIILAALLGEYLLSLISDLLNLRALSERLPEEFQDVYDAEDYRRSQQYTRERTRFGILTSSFNLVLLLAFWHVGGFNLLDLWLRQLGYGPLLTGLLYIGALVLASGLLSLPFQIYSTFVIEERYGFNKTTAKTFIADLLKGLALGALLGGVLLTGILWFFQTLGAQAWIYCWAAAVVWTLFLQLIAPTWIMPLFNKFEPLEQGDLRDSILDYADRVDFPLQNVFVMDGSRRSSKANAFFMGFGKRKRVALYDTLVEKQGVRELVAVLAHEIGHYKRRHVLQNLIISILYMGLLFFLLSLFLSEPGLFEAFYMDNMSIYAGLLFFGLLYSPIELLLSIAMQALSRKFEYQADEYAAQTYEAESLVGALKKLARQNLSNLTPHPFYVFLNYSHPPMVERIRALRSL
ncbi:MAG TPA: M48 family metallopeptidase [Acidobacteriota bacterium]|nr:M48 family metallopeptidase [Acidobacteriota bacterium]